jgi:tripartite-type tricarboxylate transporter receptor subunit TctC
MIDKRSVLLAVALAGLGLGAVGLAQAEPYPTRLIKIIVPFPPGGPTDFIARIVSQHLSALGQSVVVENQPGAGGMLGCKVVAAASHDGYTLLLGGTNTNAITPAVYKKVSYDPIKDFAAIGSIASDTEALVVVPTLPVRTLAELIAYAKDNPEKLTSGAAVGIAPHLQLELLKRRAGINMVFVPYKGAAPVVTDLLGGQIQTAITAKSVLLPHILAGKLRALAVVSTARWSELPDVPTFDELGLTGFPPALWFGLLAPAGTPAAVIDKLNGAINDGLKSPETRASIAKLGFEPKGGTPEQFGTILADEVRTWGAIAKETGVQIE